MPHYPVKDKESLLIVCEKWEHHNVNLKCIKQIIERDFFLCISIIIKNIKRTLTYN